MSEDPRDEQLTSTARSVDDPIRSKEEDLLGRWPFANRVYGAIAQNPSEQPLRTAIYGQWGHGKTSVLNLIKIIAKRNNDIVFDFSPWRYRNSRNLWRRFCNALYDALDQAGLEVPGSVFFGSYSGGKLWEKIKEGVGDIGTAVSKNWGIDPDELDILSDMMDLFTSDAHKVLAQLGDRRVMVFVDDLDRTAPALIPEILHAFGEIMRVPRVTFVMSLDPRMIHSALERENHKWSGDANFLEKIVDLPFWLSHPPQHAWYNFAYKYIVETNNYVSPEDFREGLWPLLPQNPRSIKRFGRHLRSLQAEVSRAKYIHIQSLLKVELFRSEFPELSDLLDVESVTELMLIAAKAYNQEPPPVSSVPLVEELEKRGVIDPERQNRALALLKALGYTEDLPGIDSSARDAMHAIDDPDPITASEFAAQVSAHTGQITDAIIAQWIQDIVDTRNEVASRVAESMFDAAISCRDQTLGLIWDTSSNNDTLGSVLLDCIRVLAVDIDAHEPGEPIIQAPQIERLLTHFNSLSKLTGTATELAAREREQNVTADLFRHSQLRLGELYALARRLIRSADSPVWGILDQRFTSELTDRASTGRSFAHILFNEYYHVLRSSTLRHGGPLRDAQITDAVESCKKTPRTRDSIIEFFHLASFIVGSERDDVPRDFPVKIVQSIIDAVKSMAQSVDPSFLEHDLRRLQQRIDACWAPES